MKCNVESRTTAEYCVWFHSAHTSLVDVQLNSTMRLIPGTLRSTPLPWLPVLANIEPPALRRKAAMVGLVTKVLTHDHWPIHHDILNPPQLRLTSRKPLWCVMTPTDIKSQWRESWKSVPRWSVPTWTPQSGNLVSSSHSFLALYALHCRGPSTRLVETRARQHGPC